jgi:glycosyltransferase involved in cell wall biosynthesis
LAAKGHEVLVVAPAPRRRGLKERTKILLNRSPAPSPPARSHVALAGLPFLITGREGVVEASDVPDADVIIATWWETAEWVWAMPPAKGAKVHFIQGYDAFLDAPDRVDAVWRLPFSKIAVSQWLVDLGHDRFGIEKIELVPNSVNHELFKRRPRKKGDPATVGFLFHPAEFKDMPTTVAALDRLYQKFPGTSFVSFGATRPNRGQLPAHIQFYYLPDQQAIAEIYQRCDAWLSTSRQEGFNLPPLEAMASGCPAVCAKTGRPLEIIESGVNGYLADQGDVVGFASALSRIISLPEREWAGMSKAAAAAVAHPTWEESNGLFENAIMRSRKAATS